MMRAMMLMGVMGLALVMVGCGGKMPDDLGPQGGALGPCPDSPNCVSSAVDASDEQHSIAAFTIEGDTEAAWNALIAAVEAMPRTEIVTRGDDYLYAVQTSSLMRYNDDFEFLLVSRKALIHVRSASRVGHGDMGVNRDRIEAVRATLVDRGVVEAP